MDDQNDRIDKEIEKRRFKARLFLWGGLGILVILVAILILIFVLLNSIINLFA